MDTVLTEVVNKSGSELILFFVVACVILVTAVIPLYKKIQEARTARQKVASEREERLLKIIAQNSDVIARFTAACERTYSDTKNSFERLYWRLDNLIGDAAKTKLTEQNL